MSVIFVCHFRSQTVKNLQEILPTNRKYSIIHFGMSCIGQRVFVSYDKWSTMTCIESNIAALMFHFNMWQKLGEPVH